MTDAELGKATILYEDPDEGTVEETVDNEHVAYVQDHWIVRTGEGDDGSDLVRRIPAQRVYFVERNVEAFEEEVKSLRDQVQSFASDVGGEVRTLRNRIESVASGLQRDRTGTDDRPGGTEDDAEPIEIQVGEESTENATTGAGETEPAGSASPDAEATGSGSPDGEGTGSDSADDEVEESL